MAATHFSGPVVSEAGFQTGGAVVAAGSTAGGIQLFGTTGPGFYASDGAPTFAATKGSICTNTTASTAATRLYVNTTGSTTWAAFTAAA